MFGKLISGTRLASLITVGDNVELSRSAYEYKRFVDPDSLYYKILRYYLSTIYRIFVRNKLYRVKNSAVLTILFTPDMDDVRLVL